MRALMPFPGALSNVEIFWLLMGSALPRKTDADC
jgi:hypothetical protein